MDKREQWTAWLDGELSDDECAAFEASLSNEERRRLEADARFDAALGVKLREGPGCPELAWKQVERDIRTRAAEADVEDRGGRAAPWAWGMATAAVVLVVAVFATYQARDHGAALLHVSAPTVDALSATAESEDTVAAVNRYLKDHNVGIELLPLSDENPDANVHSRVLGTRMASIGGDEAAELLFECCAEPVKLVAVRDDAPAAALLKRKRGGQAIQGPRRVGDYLVVMVNHPPGSHEPGLLDFLAPRDRETAAAFI